MASAVIKTAGPFIAYILAIYLFLHVASAKTCTTGQSSTSGVIHLTGSSCMGTDENGLLGICGSAFKVAVNAAGNIYLTPVEQGTFLWYGPGPYMLPTKDSAGYNWGNFPCKNMNATGRLDGANSAQANVMFYNDVGGPFSRLVVTGSNQLTLVANHTRGYKSPGPNCTYNYTVTSGCVMGIAASKSITCPSRYIIKTGRFGLKYCAPCLPGSTSTKTNATACTKCKAGEYNPSYNSPCQKCEGSSYSNKTGATQCEYCYTQEWQYNPAAKPVYVVSNKVGCGFCPPNSWAYESTPTQCVACKDGVKCCRTNPSANCPPCPQGFKSSTTNLTATFVLESAQPSICYKSTEALCASSFTVTVMGTCQVAYKPISRLYARSQPPCYYDGELLGDVMGKKISPSDFGAFGYYSSQANISTINPPRINLQIDSNFDYTAPPKRCRFTYRAISPSASKMGVSPAKCPVGQPGCIIKKNPPTCAKGKYVSSNIDGKTLCLKCPAGTYNPKDTTATSCKPCPAGFYATGYANTACGKCEPGTYSLGGSSTCTACSLVNGEVGVSYYSDARGSTACKACPANTYAQNGDVYPVKTTSCLASQFRNLCCAAGNCTGQTKCTGPTAPYTEPQGRAILKVLRQKTSALKDAAQVCKNAQFFRCLNPGGLISAAGSWNPTYISLKAFKQEKCADPSVTYFPDLFANVVATNRARDQEYGLDSGAYTYEIRTSKATNPPTLTILFAPTNESLPSISDSRARCSATFSLIAGAILDVRAPPSSPCPTGTTPVPIDGATDGVSLCKMCEYGNVLKNGNCEQCPAGTYAPGDGFTSCKTCPVGLHSYPGSISCYTCSNGYVPDSKKEGDCTACPKNTYAQAGFKQCKPCPTGTFSPEGAYACGVPFPK